jgi:type II secretory pathway component GspD/PulD (secretin)
MKSLLAAILIAVTCGAALAQGELEMIALRHRTPDQLIPALRPLVEPGGVLTAHGNQLIVRASRANIAEIKAALAALDTPARRYVIHVRFAHAAEEDRRALDARAQAQSGRARVDVRIADSRAAADTRADQSIQVLEGGRAMIATGSSQPLGRRHAYSTQDLQSGFEVVPRASGDGVALEVRQQRETPGAAPGAVEAQRLATTIHARLGEWVELGGAGASRDDRGIVSSAQTRTSEDRRIWIKVEEIRP